MTVAAFFVGVTASVATSLAILEMTSDRRCFSLRRDINDAFITSSIYKSKLTQLINTEASKMEGQNESEGMYMAIRPFLVQLSQQRPKSGESKENSSGGYLDFIIDPVDKVIKEFSDPYFGDSYVKAKEFVKNLLK